MRHITKDNLFEFVKILMEKVEKFDPFGIAAQSAYYFLFSIFPLLLFLVTLLPLLHIDVTAITNQISNSLLPDEIINMINEFLQVVLVQKDNSLSLIALGITIFSSSSAMYSMVKSINRIYEGDFSRNNVIFRIISIAFMISFIFMIVFSYFIISFGDNILVFFKLERLLFIISIVKYIIMPLLVFSFIYLLYRFSPSEKLRNREVLPGTFISTGLLIGFSIIFTNYISLFTSSFTKYGIFSSLMLLMLWFYLIGLFIMFGALINSSIQDLAEKRRN